MTKLFRASIADTCISRNGIGYWVDEGSPFTVDGTPMVRMHTVLVPAEGWRPTKAQALLDAASKVEAAARRLMNQADTLRSEAATEAARETVEVVA